MRHLLPFAALLAIGAFLPGCPVYSSSSCFDSSDCPGGSACDVSGRCVSVTPPPSSTGGGGARCLAPIDCQKNETCGPQGLCAPGDVATAAPDVGHVTVMNYLARSNVATAVTVAAVHTLAMMLAGLGAAWAVYRYLGLQFLRRAWLDLELVWGTSLVIAGAAGIALAL